MEAFTVHGNSEARKLKKGVEVFDGVAFVHPSPDVFRMVHA